LHIGHPGHNYAVAALRDTRRLVNECGEVVAMDFRGKCPVQIGFLHDLPLRRGSGNGRIPNSRLVVLDLAMRRWVRDLYNDAWTATIGAITTLITANDIHNDLNVTKTVANVNVDS
jgi:hypothetical protein